jgi:hypothetical protein
MKAHLSMSIKIMSLLLAISVAICSYADNIVGKSYDIKNIEDVVVHGGGRLELVQGDSESLRVEADSKIIERVVVDQSGDRLTFNVKKTGNYFNFFHWFDDSKDEVKYILQLKNLHHLGLHGASRANLGNWIGEKLTVKGSGAADATFANLTLQDLSVELSGASNSRVQQLNANKASFNLSGAANVDAKAAGHVKHLKVDASGASNFRGKLLKAVEADVHASGASNIDLDVTEFLEAGASGASNIRYLGQPKLKNNVSGASHVSAINK